METRDEVYVSSGTAARRLGISRMTLWRALQRGEITPVFHTPGGYARFRAADIATYAQHLADHQRGRDAAS